MAKKADVSTGLGFQSADGENADEKTLGPPPGGLRPPPGFQVESGAQNVAGNDDSSVVEDSSVVRTHPVISVGAAPGTQSSSQVCLGREVESVSRLPYPEVWIKTEQEDEPVVLSLRDAIETGWISTPPFMNYRRWQTWRMREGGRHPHPIAQLGLTRSQLSKEEYELYDKTMRSLYGSKLLTQLKHRDPEGQASDPEDPGQGSF